ncbi:hypothetical protein [Micromonospora sp. NPDC004704]
MLSLVTQVAEATHTLREEAGNVGVLDELDHAVTEMSGSLGFHERVLAERQIQRPY